MLQIMTKLVEWLSVALVGLALWLAAYTGSLQTAYRGELLWWVARSERMSYLFALMTRPN